jgi:ATP-dependent exoDNAse (exonuclease V) beta subunit
VNAPLTGFTVDDLTKAAQRRAADPRLSAWVSANAGAGKTKVLTDRVLRLLRPAGSSASPSPRRRRPTCRSGCSSVSAAG